MLLKIGKVLNSLREEAGIPQKELARGIFTLKEYSKIERDTFEADRMHLEALLQRLGKSGDKLEFAIPISEYHQMYFRHNTLRALAVGDLKAADKYMESYADNIETKKPLHLQSLQLLRAVRVYTEKKDAQMAVREIEKAIELTFPDWKYTDYNSVCLCRQEIQLLLLAAYLYLQISPESKTDSTRIYAGEKGAEEILKKLLKYLDEKYTDEEEQAKVLPPCLWLLGKIYIRQNNIGKALELCERGIGILAVNGVMAAMKGLLLLKKQCLEKIGDMDMHGKCCEQIEAIEFLYQVSDEIPPREEIIILLLSSMQGETIVMNELIKELREAKGISQEALCEDICTRETLSRIESGKRSPNKKKFFAMLKRMGVERETYYGFIAADDYYLYEKVRTYFMREGKTEAVLADAEKAFEELEKCLDRGYLINKQFLESVWLKRRKKETQDDWERGLEEMKQILNYSMEGYNGKLYRVPFRQEVLILVYMAVSLRRLNRKEEALEIYRQILERYEKSMVAKPFHAVPLFLVYCNYTGLLEVANHLEESERIAKEGIALSLECQRGDVAAEILANLSCVYEKQADVELTRLCMETSFRLLDLYKSEKYCNMIKEAYINMYSHDLD